MLNTSLKYPAFDNLELTTELEYSFQPYEKLHPVKTGDTITGLLNYPVWQKQKASVADPVFTQPGSAVSYLNKILVVYFYSRHWGPTSLAHLKQLNAIRHEVKYHDGNLLIIDADGEESSLQQTLWNNNLSLPVYADPGNQIAGLFKVYSEKSPAWSRYTGLEENVPLPATFVLDHFLRVVFDHNNEDISNSVPVQDVVNAVYQANTYLAGRKSA
jgi:peroxiredoxin